MSPDLICTSDQNGWIYTTLINTNENGFSNRCSLTKPKNQDFWEVWHHFSTDRGLVLMDETSFELKSFRGKVLCCLHSAHQGIIGMKGLTNYLVYWLGMNALIHNFRANSIVYYNPNTKLVLRTDGNGPLQHQTLCQCCLWIDQSGLHLGIAISWGRWNFKPCPLQYQVQCPSPQALIVIFQSDILITHIPVNHDTHATVGHPMWGIYMSSCSQYTQRMPLRIHQALSRLLLHNIVGSKELFAPHRVLTVCRGGRGFSTLFQIT